MQSMKQTVLGEGSAPRSRRSEESTQWKESPTRCNTEIGAENRPEPCCIMNSSG